MKRTHLPPVILFCCILATAVVLLLGSVGVLSRYGWDPLFHPVQTTQTTSILAVVKLGYEARLKRIELHTESDGTTTFTAITKDGRRLIGSVARGEDLRLILRRQHVRNVQTLVTGP